MCIHHVYTCSYMFHVLQSNGLRIIRFDKGFINPNIYYAKNLTYYTEWHTAIFNSVMDVYKTHKKFIDH